MQSAGREGLSAWTAVALVTGATLLGVVGLPVVFQGLTRRELSLLWFALALADAALAVLPTPVLVRALAGYLGEVASGVVRQRSWTGRTATGLARLLVAAGAVVVVQAILRRPLVAVFGLDVEPFVVEATFGSVSLLVLLGLLGWAYSVARPLVEEAIGVGLDALFVTAPSQAAAFSQAITANAEATVVSARADSDGTAEATQLAPVRKPEAGATEVVGSTAAAEHTSADETLIAPPHLPASDSTEPSY